MRRDGRDYIFVFEPPPPWPWVPPPVGPVGPVGVLGVVGLVVLVGLVGLALGVVGPVGLAGLVLGVVGPVGLVGLGLEVMRLVGLAGLGLGVVAGVEPAVPGSVDWTNPPRLLARSLTCSTTRLITLRAAAATGFGAGFGAAFLAGALRRTAVFALAFFRATGRRALELLDAGRFEAFLDAFEDFFAPLFLAEAFLEAVFFEAGRRLLEAFFVDGRLLRLLEVFFEDFLDVLFFAARFFDGAFFEDLREERFLAAGMLCLLLLLSVPGAGLDQGITMRGNLVARIQFRRTCCECHAR